MTPIKSDKMRQDEYNGSVQILPIQEADIDIVLALAKLMHVESPIYRQFPFSEPVFRGWLVAAVNQPNRYFCHVAVQNGDTVGAMMGCAISMLFSDSKMASELGIYVRHRYRGGRAGLKLVRAFEEWARDQGCSLITVGVSAGITDERAINFYKKLGYQQHGVSLRREIG